MGLRTTNFKRLKLSSLCESLNRKLQSRAPGSWSLGELLSALRMLFLQLTWQLVLLLVWLLCFYLKPLLLLSSAFWKCSLLFKLPGACLIAPVPLQRPAGDLPHPHPGPRPHLSLQTCFPAQPPPTQPVREGWPCSPADGSASWTPGSKKSSIGDSGQIAIPPFASVSSSVN